MAKNPASAAEIREHILSLRHDVARHQRAYHQDDAPLISDAQYDALVRELETLNRPILSSHPDHLRWIKWVSQPNANSLRCSTAYRCCR